MSLWSITFNCQLLEDMHCGSGTGRLGIVDDQHARDAQGRPVVWWSTLTGLLRDAADELYGLLGQPPAMLSQIRRLFGAEGEGSRSSAVALSLHFDRRAEPQPPDLDLPDFLEVTSTAREVHSRRPLDETLRTTEMAAAGLAAHGEIRVVGDQQYAEFVQRCLRRLASLGGGKTRGMGTVKIDNLKLRPLDLSGNPTAAPPAGPCRLRLLLRNLEPLCLAATGFPGNVIETLSFIPGQVLRGAILTGLTELGRTTGDDYANAQVQFLSAYVVCESDDKTAGDLAQWESLPLPLTVQETKPTERKGSEHLPWWVGSRGGFRTWPQKEVERDTLNAARTVDEQPRGQAHKDGEADDKFKRIKTEDYLVTRGGGRFYRGRPQIHLLMRNGTPVSRVERRFDSRRPTADGSPERLEKEGDLFTQTVLTEGQYFLADIRFESKELAEAFARDAAPYLDGNDRHWLRIGRGGRPVCVERYQWLEDDTTKKLSGDCFTLTLTSDLIARAEDLTFRTTLDGPALWELAKLDPRDYDPSVIIEKDTSETRVVHGFNTASGTLRSPDLAIRRGSAFRVCGTPSGKLKSLFDALAKREAQGQGLGERTEEGFGRFRLDHPCHHDVWLDTDKTDDSSRTASANVPSGQERKEEQDPKARQRRQREAVIAAVLEAVQELELAKRCNSKEFPARTQWQWLRHAVEPAKTSEELKRILDEIKTQSGKLSGKMWLCKKDKKDDQEQPLIKAIQQRCSRWKTFAEQRLFLIYLARWVVAQQDAAWRRKFRQGEERT